MTTRKSSLPTERHPFHSLCSYIGCFPPRVPQALLQRWAPASGWVLDPFCGSGTTLVEARLRGLPCVGVDLNPLAVAVASGKTQDVHLADVEYRVAELAASARTGEDLRDVPEGMRTIYHPRTLAQLCCLRRSLDPSRAEDLFLRAALLGIMHGKARADGSTAYLSIDMPNTFSMSPDYVRGFVAKHELTQPRADVFSKLRDRARWLLRDGVPGYGTEVRVAQGDATRLSALEPLFKGIHVGTVITSPPYLGILRYGAFNWIRLWLLGFDPYQIDKLLDGTDSLDRYLSFILSFLRSLGNILDAGAMAVLVIGDVVEFGHHVRLAERVWEEVADLIPFEFVEMGEDTFDVKSKTTRIWGEDKRGNATPVDRVLVLRKAAASRTSMVRIPALKPPQSAADES